MEALVDYIKPELLITAIALYFMGIALKEAQAVKDKYIPLILGGQGSLYAEFMFLLPVPVKMHRILQWQYLHPRHRESWWRGFLHM